MNEKLKIPQTLKVGFQERKDTYSGKLAFVVYVNEKGNISSERSWSNWKSDSIKVEEYKNEPINGFVLNRDVGGTQRSYSWNARREKVRVYDPRGFEVEINIENLLFILQECSSIKGKGLEGEFVYSWDRNQLVLLPVSSKEYSQSMEFTNLQTKKVTKSDMIEGCVYKTKYNEEVMYLGRHDWYEFKHEKTYTYYNNVKFFDKKKKHIFILLNDKNTQRYIVESGFTKIAERVSNTPLDIYSDEYEKLKESKYTSAPKKLIFKKVKFKEGYNHSACIKKGDQYHIGTINYKIVTTNCKIVDFTPRKRVEMINGEYKETCIQRFLPRTSSYSWRRQEEYSEKVEISEVGELSIQLKNGKNIKI